MAVRDEIGEVLRIQSPILVASPLPTMVLDTAGLVRLWNPAAERLLGWAAQDVIGNRPPGVPEDERAAFDAQFRRALAGETLTGVEGRRRTKAGDVLNVRLAVAPLADVSGEVIGVVRTFEDITDRKRTEEALRKSEERFRSIVATANEGIWLIDRDARTVYANDRMAEILGSTSEELRTRTVLDFLFPGEEPLARERIGANLQGKVEQFDFRFRRADGGEVLVLGCTSPVRDAGGAISGALGMFTDITERVHAEQDRARLAAENARLYREAQQVAAERAAILAQMADGVIIVDPAGNITFRNEAALRLADRPASTSVHDAAVSLQVRTADGRPYPLDELPLARALQERVTISDARWRVRYRDGTERVLQGSAAPLLGGSAELLGAVTAFRDITDEAALEQQKENFLSAAAHDLKTPLTSLKGLAQLLQRRLAREGATDPEALRDGLVRIEQNATRMTSLINELLDVSHLRAGQSLRLNRWPTDLVALVSRAVAEHEERTGEDRITVQARAPELVGAWDAERLERVIANLLSNAAKYSEEPSPITVEIGEEAAGETCWAVVSVRDRGIGIPPDDLPHIFERFHRARNVSQESMGTGIGLSGAKQIVEQHGGTIEVESEEGRGSTFTVHLPLSASEP